VRSSDATRGGVYKEFLSIIIFTTRRQPPSIFEPFTVFSRVDVLNNTHIPQVKLQACCSMLKTIFIYPNGSEKRSPQQKKIEQAFM
jgi:hypothetical protein